MKTNIRAILTDELLEYLAEEYLKKKDEMPDTTFEKFVKIRMATANAMINYGEALRRLGED